MEKITKEQVIQTAQHLYESGAVETTKEAAETAFNVAQAINDAIDAGVPDEVIRNAMLKFMVPMS